MKFADFICREAILAELQAMDKEGAIREMVQSLCKAGKVEQGEYESIVKAILKREELGSTGIGRGVAVPHTKHPSVDRLVGSVAVSPQGVDFASLDGEVVHLFFLLVSPPDRPGDHLRALENICASFGTTPSAVSSSRPKAWRTFNCFWTKPTTTSSDRDAAMSDTVISRTVVVTDPAGVHLRTAVAIAEAVRRGRSRVTLMKDGHSAHGNEVLQVAMMAVACGSTIQLEAVGSDAAEILNELEPLFAGRFGDDEPQNTA